MSNTVAYDLFQGDFKASEYVSKILSSSKIETVKNAEFDPVPYINCFESNVYELKRFYLTIEKRVEQLSTSLESEEGEVSQKIAALGGAFDEVMSSFSYLNQAAESISSTAVRIGKQLESIQNEKSRALDAREIVEYFLEFNSSGKCSRIESLSLSSTFDSKIALAGLLKKLNYISNANISGAERASDGIRAIYAKFETETLTDFMTAFDEDNVSSMKDTANILVTLNDASSCIKVFIDKHAFFQQEYDCSRIKGQFFNDAGVRVKIDFSSKTSADMALLEVFDQILSTLSADWKYLDEVFEEPRSVMNQLLKRVFNDIIMRHIDEGLKQSGLHSTAQYLRYLASTYASTLEFIDRLVLMYREHMDDLPATALDNAVEQTRTFLLNLRAEIYGRYTRPQDIQALEARFLKEVLDICAVPIKNEVNAKKNAKAAKNLFNISGTSDYKPVSANELQQRCQFYLFQGGQLLLDPQIVEASHVSLATFKRLLLLVAEAGNRFCVFFKEKHELCDLLENYLSFFLETFRKQCVQPAFQYLVDEEDWGASGKVFDDRNLVLVKSVNSILGAMQAFFEDQIIPLTALVSPVCCRKAFEMKNAFFEAGLRYINKTIRGESGAISTHLNAIAQKYIKRSDFKPKPDNLAAFNACTVFCTSTKDYLRSVARAVKTNLEAPNSTKFLIRTGKLLFELLVDIIKKLSFNDVGALVLLNDINSFSEMISEFGAEPARELAQYFGFLREVANILMVKPENLRAVVQEGTLNMIDVRLLYPFMVLRSDFKTSQIETLFPDMSSQISALTANNPLSIFQ